MLQVFHVDVAIDQDVASVSKVCCKHLFKNVSFVFRRMFASVSDLDVAYVSHMLQEYVPMILVVSVLCCSKCFHVAVVLSRCCTASRVPVVRARGALGSCGQRHARPHLGSWVPLTRREERGRWEGAAGTAIGVGFACGTGQGGQGWAMRASKHVRSSGRSDTSHALNICHADQSPKSSTPSQSQMAIMQVYTYIHVMYLRAC
jgi:hypothetical protein